MNNFVKGIAEYFTSVLSSSQFYEKGVLTPEEFVRAGDQLIFKCRTWEWASGEESLQKPYLPKEKQYLITRNVPSLRRANTYELADAKETLVEPSDDGDGWLSTHADRTDKAEVKDMDDQPCAVPSTATGKTFNLEAHLKDSHIQSNPDAVVRKLGDISIQEEYSAPSTASVPDMEDVQDENLLAVEEADEFALRRGRSGDADDVLRATEPEEDIIRTRTYDLSICYDKYYQTPRVYLFGYDENRQPLPPEKIMEDISGDHANKTVTVETHPHVSIPHLSIHPCKHAHVMKRLVDQMSIEYERESKAKFAASKAKTLNTSPDDKEKPVMRFNVEQYMFLFLKFISSVIPTIEYDYTIEV